MPSPSLDHLNRLLTYPQDAKWGSSNSILMRDASDCPKSLLNEYKQGLDNSGDWIGSRDSDIADPWHSSIPGYPAVASALYLWQSRNTTVDSSKGNCFYFHMETSDTKEVSKWFEVGTLNGAEFPSGSGTEVSLTRTEYDNAQVSGLQNVTSAWVQFSATNTSQSRSCYAYLTRMAIRYIYKRSDGSCRHRIVDATIKVGDYSYDTPNNSSDQLLVGYQIADSERDFLKSNNAYFAGFRFQLKLKRGGSGLQKDHVRVISRVYALGWATLV